jgi:opacity protein-like surface antigen
MKNLFIAAVFILACTQAHSQAERGSFYLNVSPVLSGLSETNTFKYSGKSEETKTTEFMIQPKIGFYSWDRNIIIGGYLNYDIKKVDDDASISKNHSIGVGPFLRVYMNSKSKISPFIQANVGYSSSDIEITEKNVSYNSTDGYKMSGFNWGADVGLEYMVNHSIGIEFALGYARTSLDYDDSAYRSKSDSSNSENISSVTGGLKYQVGFSIFL